MKKVICFFYALVVATSFSSMASEPHRGYRGFADLIGDAALDISIYGGEATNSKFHAGISTSHGFQFNRWLFAGGGLAVENFVKENTTYAAAIFGHLRSDLYFGRFKPNIDIRLGYNMANYGGVYFSPAIGYRIDTKSPVGINVALGFSMIGNRSVIEYYSPAPGWTNWRRRHSYDTTLSFRVGIDFQL